MLSLVVNWTTNQGETKGEAQLLPNFYLSPSVDPTLIVDLFCLYRNARLLHMLKQGKGIT